ncbi:MAG: response regulator transcription factor [Chloroflexi bacterium]|nr:response regulator transcription factor [Chloroflexota bacterium]
MSESAIQVIIADDHPVFRDGLRASLELAPEFVVVGEAGSGNEAVELARRHTPRLVLMDIQMPDMNGIEATRRVREVSPESNVLIVTMFEDDASVFAAMRAGARGYVLKGVRADELVRAMRAVSSGEAVFSPAIAVRMSEYFGGLRSESMPRHPFPELSQREREILDLIAAGSSNTDIAEKLYLSPKTVRNHITSIFDKLQIADRAQAIVRARQAGLGGEVAR